LLRKNNVKKNSLCEYKLQDLVKIDLPENLRKRATHVIEEQERVITFRMEVNKGADLEKLGQLLAQSHISSSQNFENSCEELDFLAEKLNKQKSVLGARLTGGGFGGAVMAWVRTSFTKTDAEKIQQLYYNRFKQRIDSFHFRASNGAREESLLKK